MFCVVESILVGFVFVPLTSCIDWRRSRRSLGFFFLSCFVLSSSVISPAQPKLLITRIKYLLPFTCTRSLSSFIWTEKMCRIKKTHRLFVWTNVQHRSNECLFCFFVSWDHKINSSSGRQTKSPMNMRKINKNQFCLLLFFSTSFVKWRVFLVRPTTTNRGGDDMYELLWIYMWL